MTALAPTGLAPTGLTTQLSAGSGDVTAPILSSPTGENTGKYSAIGSVTTNEAGGILFYATNTVSFATAGTVKAANQQAVNIAGLQEISITGLLAGTQYYNHFLHRDAAGNESAVASSAAWSTEVEPLPQGTFTIGSITTGNTTASVPYTYSDVDATSIQYRLNGGSAVTATPSPQALSGLTAETSYTIEFRAVNAAGNGAWSSPANFTTQAEPSTEGTFASEPLHRLVDGVLMANKALTYFRLYNSTTGALVVSKTDLSTNSSGIVSFTDPAVVTSTTYKADWQTADGEFCMPSKAAT